MASAEEVQSLKREVEMLKQMLEKERSHSGSGEFSTRSSGSARMPSPNRTRYHQRQKQDDHHFGPTEPRDDEYDTQYRREPTGRRPVTTTTSPTREKMMRSKGWPSPQQHNQAILGATYTQFVPIDTKKGKWWLTDRQILSRNAPSPNDRTVAMKVRETWQWSGRTVLVDKIVTGPRPRDDACDGSHSDREHDDLHVHDLQDETVRCREELRKNEGDRPDTSPIRTPLSSTTVAAHVAFHNSKLLTEEYIQPRHEGNADVEERSSSMRTASQRVEAQTTQAGANVNGPALASSDAGEHDEMTNSPRAVTK